MNVHNGECNYAQHYFYVSYCFLSSSLLITLHHHNDTATINYHHEAHFLYKTFPFYLLKFIHPCNLHHTPRNLMQFVMELKIKIVSPFGMFRRMIEEIFIITWKRHSINFYALIIKIPRIFVTFYYRHAIDRNCFLCVIVNLKCIVTRQYERRWCCRCWWIMSQFNSGPFQ